MRAQSAVPSAFSFLNSFSDTLRRHLLHTRRRGTVVFANVSHLRTCILHMDKFRARGFKLTHTFSPLFGQRPTVVHGADPPPRGHGRLRKLRSVAGEASAKRHTSFQSVCPVKRTTRGSTSTPQPPSTYFTRISPEEADQPLQFQEIHVLAFEKTARKQRGPIQLQRQRCSGCASVMHPARWFFAFPIKAHAFPLLAHLAQLVQGEPVVPC